MLRGLLLLAGSLQVLEHAVGRVAFVHSLRSKKPYLSTEISCLVVLTPEELEAWHRADTEVEERAGILKRGLLRKQFIRQPSREAHTDEREGAGESI